MLLSFHSETKGDALRYFCFLQPEDGDDDPRYDFISLSLDTVNLTLGGIIHIDIGYPVLQPQALQVSIPQQLLEEINSQGDTLKLLELITLGGLALGTNLPINEVNIEEASFVDPLSDLGLEFTELFGTETHEEHLPISQRIIDFGMQNSLLERVGRHFVLNSNVEISLGELEPAFESVELLRQAYNSYKITLPSKSEDFDLNLALDVLKLVPNPTAQTLWFYGNTKHPSHKYRIQAAQSYPLLAEYLLKIEKAVAAIDFGEKLQPVIAEITGLNKGKLKRITKMVKPSSPSSSLDQQDIGDLPIEIQRTRRFTLANTLRVETIIKALNEVDTGILPNSYGDWERFLQITSGCALTLEKRLNISLSELLNSSKGNWGKFHHSLAQNAEIPVEGFHLDHITYAAADALEAIDDFTRTIFLPRILFHILEIGKPLPLPTTSDLLRANTASFNLLRGETLNLLGFLFHLGFRWSNRYPQIAQIISPVKEEKKVNQAFEEKRKTKSWPRLACDFEASNDLVVRNLTSEKELKDESDRLDHCVGNLYVNSAKKGRCHIFSVQSADGSMSYSTFEICPPNTTDKIQELQRINICQHKGKNNRVPNKKCKEALTQWMKAVKQESLELNLDEVIEWKHEVNIKRDQNKFHRSGLLSPKIAWQRLLGENWDNPDIHSQLWYEWQKYILSGKLAKSSDSEIILKSLVTQNFVETISP